MLKTGTKEGGTPMGYMRHYAILVTSCDIKHLSVVHKKACTTFSSVSGLMLSAINSYWTFCVPSCGSKLGWPEADENEKQRKEFLDWLDNQRFGDGGSSCSWVEIQYGDDEGETRITRDSDERWRAKK